jgi:hypothetical protein
VQTRWQWIVCVRESSKANQMSTVGCPLSLLCSSCATRILVLSLQRRSDNCGEQLLLTTNTSSKGAAFYAASFLIPTDIFGRRPRGWAHEGFAAFAPFPTSPFCCYLLQLSAANVQKHSATSSHAQFWLYDSFSSYSKVRPFSETNNDRCWVRKAGGLETRKRTGGN